MNDPHEAVLGQIGVTEDEERVYRLLLTARGHTASSLKTHADMGTTRLRRALDGLERKAMVSRRGGSPTTYQPAPPAIVIDTLIAQREEELRRARVQGLALIELAEADLGSMQADDIVEVLSSRDAVAERWLQLQRATRESMDVLVRPPYAQAGEDIDEPIQRQLIERGVQLRAIYDQCAIEEPTVLEHVRVMVEMGEQARIVTGTPIKVALFDRRTAIVPLAHHQPAQAIEAGLIVHESALLDALLWLFDSLWTRGSEVRFGEARADEQIDEATVLTLLAAGLKDEAVARQLGVSTKTVRRRISAVLARLGVSTRFQAGLALAREGWADKSSPDLDVS